MPLKTPLLIFAGYLPVYLVLVFYLQTKIKNYSLHADTVCFLATAKKPWGPIFNASTFLYGLLSLALPVGVITLLGISTLTIMGAFFVGLTGVATMLVGLFPLIKYTKTHEYISYLAFLNVFLTAATFIYIFSRFNFFSPAMKLLSYWVIGTVVPLGLVKVYGKKTNSLLEWLAFIGTIAWNFGLSVSLFIKI
jgi:hypothetical protein